jgi:SAM-dependent methyltransferase
MEISFGMESKWRNMMRSLLRYKRVRGILVSLTGGEEDVLWCRVVRNRESHKMVQSLQPSRLKVLEISGKYWGKFGFFKEYKSVHYPEYDVCEASLPESFDLIIAEQVFEHLLWPYRAGKNVYGMLKPGGHFLITTPFFVRIHNHPVDCTRWTERGLKYFLAECGFPLEKIQTASWGNRACIKANLRRWAGYHRRLHSLHNEPDFPVTVWALAQK